MTNDTTIKGFCPSCGEGVDAYTPGRGRSLAGEMCEELYCSLCGVRVYKLSKDEFYTDTLFYGLQIC